jgi:hypothetical protein
LRLALHVQAARNLPGCRLAGGNGKGFSSLVFQIPFKKGFDQEIQMPVGTSGTGGMG